MTTRARPALFMIFLTACLPCLSASEQEIRNSIALGALAFADNCRKCHRIDGYGEEALYPSLHDPALLQDKSVLIQTILNGRSGHEQGNDSVEQPLMPALNYLTNEEVAAIIAFISNSWGKEVLLVTESEIERAREALREDH